jgi:hypothetical protein
MTRPPNVRFAFAPSMIEVATPLKRTTAILLLGQGVSTEKVPCGDGDDDECYALCDDKQGCSVVGEVKLP